MRAFLSAILLFMLATSLPVGASASNRVALIVGNSAYTRIPALRNPKNDADLMAAALRETGFDVVLALDADRRALGRAIRDFGTRLRAAGKNAVGLFYYAGHGVQYDGQNYLIPLNAQIDFASDLDLEAFELNDVLRQMALSGSSFNIAILDACRNNPYPASTRATARGLARVSSYSSSLVAFAAAPGEVANDGTGENSPYTAALADAIRTPGLTVPEVFRRTRVAVLEATKGAQTPWEESSLTEQFFFVEKEDDAVADTKPDPQDNSKPDGSRSEVEITFWNSIKDSGNPDLLAAYLERYPNGEFSVIAAILLKQLTAEPDETAAEKPGREQADLKRGIQEALSRLGCDPGTVDGVWGARSRAALDRFAKYTRRSIPGEPVSMETLRMLRKEKGRVCPLDCGPRQVERGGQCVARTCPPDKTLNAGGECVDARPRGRIAGAWVYRTACKLLGTLTGTFTVRMTGDSRFVGSSTNDQSGIVSSIEGHVSGDAVAYTLRYTDGFGLPQTERFSGRMSENSTRIEGSMSGGWVNGCSVALTRG